MGTPSLCLKSLRGTGTHWGEAAPLCRRGSPLLLALDSRRGKPLTCTVSRPWRHLPHGLRDAAPPALREGLAGVPGSRAGLQGGPEERSKGLGPHVPPSLDPCPTRSLASERLPSPSPADLAFPRVLAHSTPRKLPPPHVGGGCTLPLWVPHGPWHHSSAEVYPELLPPPPPPAGTPIFSAPACLSEFTPNPFPLLTAPLG